MSTPALNCTTLFNLLYNIYNNFVTRCGRGQVSKLGAKEDAQHQGQVKR